MSVCQCCGQLLMESRGRSNGYTRHDEPLSHDEVRPSPQSDCRFIASAGLLTCFADASALARQEQRPSASLLDMMRTLVRSREAAGLLADRAVNSEALSHDLDALADAQAELSRNGDGLPQIDGQHDGAMDAARVEALLAEAQRLASLEHAGEVGLEHLLSALASDRIEGPGVRLFQRAVSVGQVGRVRQTKDGVASDTVMRHEPIEDKRAVRGRAGAETASTQGLNDTAMRSLLDAVRSDIASALRGMAREFHHDLARLRSELFAEMRSARRASRHTTANRVPGSHPDPIPAGSGRTEPARSTAEVLGGKRREARQPRPSQPTQSQLAPALAAQSLAAQSLATQSLSAQSLSAKSRSSKPVSAGRTLAQQNSVALGGQTPRPIGSGAVRPAQSLQQAATSSSHRAVMSAGSTGQREAEGRGRTGTPARSRTAMRRQHSGQQGRISRFAQRGLRLKWWSRLKEARQRRRTTRGWLDRRALRATSLRHPVRSRPTSLQVQQGSHSTATSAARAVASSLVQFSPPTRQAAASRSQPIADLTDEDGDNDDGRVKRFYLSVDDDIVQAPSIGPKTAERLRPHGLLTVRDLLQADPKRISSALASGWIKPETVTGWQHQARLVCTIPWLRGTHAQMLAGAGFSSAEAVVAIDLDQVAAAVLRFAATREGQRVLRNAPAPDFDRIAAWHERAHDAELDRAA